MLKKKSLYKCPICKVEFEALAGIIINCSNCNVKAEEVKKGLITKIIKNVRK